MFYVSKFSSYFLFSAFGLSFFLRHLRPCLSLSLVFGVVFSLIDLNTDLVSAFGDRQAFIIRWMAAVSLKNAVDRFWRRNYTEEERGRLTEEQNAIKESLLSGVLLKELDPKIRMPVAVTISKIARLVRMFFYPQF